MEFLSFDKIGDFLFRILARDQIGNTLTNLSLIILLIDKFISLFKTSINNHHE